MRDKLRKLQQGQNDLRGKYNDLKKRSSSLPSLLHPMPSQPLPNDSTLVDMLVSTGLNEDEARAHLENLKAGIDAREKLGHDRQRRRSRT